MTNHKPVLRFKDVQRVFQTWERQQAHKYGHFNIIIKTSSETRLKTDISQIQSSFRLFGKAFKETKIALAQKLQTITDVLLNQLMYTVQVQDDLRLI